MTLSFPARALFILLLLVALPAHAQQPILCGNQQRLDPDVVRQALALDAQRGGDEGPVRTLKVKVIIAAAPMDGPPLVAFRPSEVQAQIDATNEIFARCNIGIQFQLCGPMRTVVDYGLFYTGFQASAVVAQYEEPGYINAFFVQELPFNLGGASIGPQIYVSRYGARNTLAHEIGHALGLNHTHDYLFESELVDGSNCTFAGDMLCDTPADPNLITPGLVVQPCAYVGTITDANGDLYAPMLSNVMSYSPCLVDSFSHDQGALMRYYADSIWIHLQRAVTPATITPFDTRLCDNAGPIALSATPEPGTFSGIFVTGTTLNNTPNPPGEYSVQYLPSTPPDGPTALVDQFCLPYSWGPNAHIGFSTDSVWQSFAPQLDGEFLRLDVYTSGITTQPLRLRLFAGAGVQGAPLLDLTSTMDADTAWTRFELAAGTNSANVGSYTALFTAAQPFLAMVPQGAGYLRGESSINAQDVEFRHWVTATPPCQEALRYYALRQVAQRLILSLPEAVCHSDERPVRFLADSLRLLDSSTLLDGEASTGFVPAQLATGAHIVEHRYTLEGCTDTVLQTFVVEPTPAFTFPNSAPSICTTDPPVVLDAEPAGGFFRINGVRDSLLVPAALGVGTHTIDHLYTAQLDTLRFTDQLCCYTGVPDNAVLLPGDLVWQTFTTDQSGILENLQLGVQLMGITRTFDVSIHAGADPTGPVLWSDTRTTAEGYNGLFGGVDLPLTFGTTYTAAFRYLPDNTPQPEPLVFYFRGNGYSGGTGQVANGTLGDDLYFREIIRQSFPCSDSTSYTIDVEVCTSITSATWTGVSVAPNPFDHTLVLRTGAEAIRHQLLSVDGRVLATGWAAANAQVPLPVEGLSAGCYLLQLVSTDGRRTEVVRVVKE